MAADFQITVGTHKTLVPSVTDPAGGAFPAGSTFLWEPSTADAMLDSNTAMSPSLLGVTPTQPDAPMTIKFTVSENGFTHSASHTIDVIAAPVDPIKAVDFALQ